MRKLHPIFCIRYTLEFVLELLKAVGELIYELVDFSMIIIYNNITKLFAKNKDNMRV